MVLDRLEGEPVKENRSLDSYARRVLYLFLSGAYILAKVLARVGEYLVKSRNWLLYAVLIVISIIVPPIGILLVGAMFLWLNEERWDRPERIRSVLRHG